MNAKATVSDEFTRRTEPSQAKPSEVFLKEKQQFASHALFTRWNNWAVRPQRKYWDRACAKEPARTGHRVEPRAHTDDDDDNNIFVSLAICKMWYSSPIHCTAHISYDVYECVLYINILPICMFISLFVVHLWSVRSTLQIECNADDRPIEQDARFSLSLPLSGFQRMRPIVCIQNVH